MKFILVEEILTEGKNIETTWEQYKNKIKYRETFDSLIRMDPTYNGGPTTGDYGVWLLNMFVKNQFVKVESEEQIKNLLTEFRSKKTQLQNRDINQYKTIDELQSALQSTDYSDRQKERQLRNNFKDAKLVYQDSDWQIWVPETYEASCTLGAGSGWCTADTRTRSHYDGYLDRGGEYYILISKHNPQEKYQFHFESDQFFGSGTNPGHKVNYEYRIDYEEFIEKYPKVGEFFESIGKELIQPADFCEYLRQEYPTDANGNMYADFSCRDFVQYLFESGDDLEEVYYNAKNILNLQGSDSYIKDIISNENEELNEALHKIMMNYMEGHELQDSTTDILVESIDEILSDKDLQEQLLKTYASGNGIEYVEWDTIREHASTQEIARGVEESFAHEDIPPERGDEYYYVEGYIETVSYDIQYDSFDYQQILVLSNFNEYDYDRSKLNDSKLFVQRIVNNILEEHSDELLNTYRMLKEAK